MGRFNLIDEPWISVMINENGETQEVSLAELFQNASQYKRLTGDSATQDFAVLRVLLAVLHTVFSRFDSKGNPYEYFEVDEYLRQSTLIDEDDVQDYAEDLCDTWEDLWKTEEFPSIVSDYLEKWHDHFYLFDDKYPFFQVTKETVTSEKINYQNPSPIYGKNINRLISQSSNKIALFSPKYEFNGNKEILTSSELARWLITFQSYAGSGDKAKFVKEKYQPSKGWLYDIGGVYLEGENLHQTLLLNFPIAYREKEQLENCQKPCWEYNDGEIIDWYFSEREVDNITELYTIWSRAIYIDPKVDINAPFKFGSVKLPSIKHQNQFIEPMTIWTINRSGENKGTFTPRKHQISRSMWRSFGLITLPHSYQGEQSRRPGILDWFNSVNEIIKSFNVKINAISLQDDGQPASRVPINEIYDYLKINDLILTDATQGGWLPRVNEVVETTKKVIDSTYRYFLNDIRNIRQLSSDHQFVNRNVESVYYAVDQPFRNWLSSLQPDDSKADRIFQWHKVLKRIVNEEAGKLLKNASYRDYAGIEKDGKVENVVTAYNKFKYYLNQRLEERN